MSIDRDLICRLEFIRDYECKVDAEVNAINEALAELSKHTEEHTETHACDLIARHDAIDTVRHLQTYKLAEGDDMLLVDLADVQTELMMMPSAEPKWIPASEGLPEDYQDVLVWFEYFRYGDYNRMYSTYGIGNYSNRYDSWLINLETGWKDLHVFAWMPMPEPPKMEGE